MQTIKRWKDRGTRHGGKSMLLASAALTVMMMNAGLAKADNECGSGSPVFCKASSYGNITYPDGGVVLLENSDMIVTGNITIGSLSNSGGQAFFSASLYRSISGAINVSAPTDGAVIGINTPSITGVPAITGPIAATAAGTGDASITIHQDVWVRSAMSSRAVASYQKNSGDAVVTIEAGAFIDQVGDSLAVLTENIGSGNAVVNINGGTIRNEGGAIVRADNQGIGNTSITLASGRIVGAGANSVGLEAHATSDGSTASVIVTSGTIENTAEAIDVYHRDGDGTALVSIDETTGETKIDGEIYIDATVTQFKLFDGDLSTTIPGGFEGVVILDSAVATADLMGGTITTFKDSASAAVYLTNSDYNEDPDMLEANLIGTKINISGNGGAAFFLDVFDNDRNSQVNISGGSIRDQGATSRTQAVTFEPDGLNDTFGFDMSGGLIQLDAQDAVGVLVTTGAGTNYEFDLSGGEISIDKGTVIFIDVPIDNLDSLNGAISVSVAIGEKMTASGGKALLDNWNTSEDTVIDFTTSGTVAGDIFGERARSISPGPGAPSKIISTARGAMIQPHCRGFTLEARQSTMFLMVARPTMARIPRPTSIQSALPKASPRHVSMLRTS
ncbi:autotransporter outer membrane beta-barrel domain-containing protein [Martelella soudanensis]|uniref:hypothetical protein n=1 Tax=Martelella sp. NC18 TaxID=2740297 RepID=UPI0015DDAB94|nr:hypothetical protein [Martelella sp. NC18]